MPSVAEVAVYLSLAVAVAVVVLFVNGRPWWHAAVVVAGAAAVLGALAFASRRPGTPAADQEHRPGRVRRRRRR